MERKSYIKGLLTGIIGSTLFISSITSVDAFAPYYKNIKALVTSIKISVDGKQIVQKSDPLLIEGTTYLPLRDIGEALGKEVKWDGANNTIFIGQEQKSYRPSIGISQLKPIYGETNRDTGFSGRDYLNKGYGGKDYLVTEEEGGEISLYKQNFSTVNSIAFLDSGSIAYSLYDNKYKVIHGLAGVDDTNLSSSEKGTIIFYGDGKEIAKITTGTKLDEPILFEVDITGIEKLEIKNIKSSSTASRVALVDVFLEAVQE